MTDELAAQRAKAKIDQLYAQTGGEDVPGVLHWVWFDGGHLDGKIRPIALHGAPSIRNGSTYETIAPTRQVWAYSIVTDRYELISDSIELVSDPIEPVGDVLDVPSRDPVTGQYIPGSEAHWAHQSVHARYPSGTNTLDAIRDAAKVFFERSDGTNLLPSEDEVRHGPGVPWHGEVGRGEPGYGMVRSGELGRGVESGDLPQGGRDDERTVPDRHLPPSQRDLSTHAPGCNCMACYYADLAFGELESPPDP